MTHPSGYGFASVQNASHCSGCRVLSYCVMSNHFDILPEVPPMPEGGIPEELLLKRLAATILFRGRARPLSR